MNINRSYFAEKLRFEDTPFGHGYHMPAEWEKHDAIWLSWPYNLDSFPQIEEVEKTYITIIKAICESEMVNLLVKDEMMQAEVIKMLAKSKITLKRIRFHLGDYADVWFRDYGPTFLVDESRKKLAMVNWMFNAWGEKYPELINDNRIPSFMNEDLNLKCFKPDLILEGGSIDVNGNGTVLTTEQCLLNKNRNPGISKNEIEAYLREYLGITKVIWLNQGIVGDDTDGHVDDIARFASPTTVFCAYEQDREDENYSMLKENYEILNSEVDQDGNRLKVIKLPMPGFIGRNGRLPASYANFYIGNESVLVPVFEHDNDQTALKIIQEIFPNRRVVGINCIELVQGLGTIHCISLQQPSIKQ
ncbi:MAG: agmatine deiminase family protein [Methanotrichaceae archaeon]|nr:agmatine deiminase family protein [Methanotrichaceae archaeon]